MRWNQLVDPNNHQKGLTAKGLSSFRGQFIYEEANLEGDIDAVISETRENRFCAERRHFINTRSTYPPRGVMIIGIVGATSAGGYTRQSPGMRAPCMVLWQPECRWPKMTNWLWGCWPKTSVIFTFLTFLCGDKNNPIAQSTCHTTSLYNRHKCINSKWKRLYCQSHIRFFNHCDQGR